MKVIELVLVYCALSAANPSATPNPDQCVERRPMFEEPLTMMGCMMNAQTVGAAFVRDHPQWELASWRCEVDKPQERHA